MRTGAAIISTHHDKKWNVTEILAAPALYVVLYRGEPFTVRVRSALTDKPPKYRRTSFTYAGMAKGLADRLNKRFGTTDFTVHTADIGDIIYPVFE